MGRSGYRLLRALLLALAGAAPTAWAQDAPLTDPAEAFTSAENPVIVDDAPASASGPEYMPDPDHTEAEPLASRAQLTGDWLERRSSLADQGITFNLYGTQFYQGVAAGGGVQEGEYGGKFDYLTHLDGSKFGAAGFLVDLHGESRLGTSVNLDDGLIAPSNIAMSLPKEPGNVSALTGVRLSQQLSESLVVYAGKLNTLDELSLRFSSELGLDRPGIGGFMNTSLVFNPIASRTIPYATAAVGVATLRDGGQSPFSLTLYDAQERATTGMQDLFSQGVVINPDLNLRGRVFGRPSLLNLGATYSTAQYTSVEPAAYLVIPNIGIVTGTETGSWSLYANGFHALHVDPADEKRGWGVFGQFGVSDGNPNPVQFVANGGVAGRSMIPHRTLDTFGVAFFYLGLSSSFKELAAPVLPQQDELGGELFYNVAVTPWCRLTADLQVAQPSTQGLDTVIIPGMRLQVTF